MGQNICGEYWITYRQRNEENIGARFIPAVSGPHCKESNEIPYSTKNDADEMRSQNVKQVGILLISELVWIFHASTIAQVQAFFTGGNGQGEIGKCVIKILLRWHVYFLGSDAYLEQFEKAIVRTYVALVSFVGGEKQWNMLPKRLNFPLLSRKNSLGFFF